MATVTLTKTNTSPPNQTIEVTVPQHTSPGTSEGGSLPPIHDIALIACLSAVIAWGVVQAVKQGFQGYSKQSSKPEPWWVASLLRALAILVGALTGWLLFDPMGASGVRHWGLVIGGSGGALATIIVAAIKKRIKGAQ